MQLEFLKPYIIPIIIGLLVIGLAISIFFAVKNSKATT